VSKQARAVKTVHTHIGVQLRGTVGTSVDIEKQKCSIAMAPMGVHIAQPYLHEGKQCLFETIVPYANIKQLDLLPEKADEAK
jgi:hypothetical protein